MGEFTSFESSSFCPDGSHNHGGFNDNKMMPAGVPTAQTHFYQPQVLPQPSQQLINGTCSQSFESDESSGVSLQESWDTKVYANLQSNREVHGAGMVYGTGPSNFSPVFSGNTSQGATTCSTEGTPGDFHRLEQYTPPAPAEGIGAMYYRRSPTLHPVNGAYNELNGNAIPLGSQALDSYPNRAPQGEERIQGNLAHINNEICAGFFGRPGNFESNYFLQSGQLAGPRPGEFPRPELVGSAHIQHPPEPMMANGREMFHAPMESQQMQSQQYQYDVQQRVPLVNCVQNQPGFQPAMPIPPPNAHHYYPQQNPNNSVGYTTTPYDEMAAQAQIHGTQRAAQQIEGPRRKNASRKATATLKKWLSDNTNNPYPTKNEKAMLASTTGMSAGQISTWFANARRRLKKENKMTWAPRTGSTDTRPRVPEIVAGEDANRQRENATHLEGVPQSNLTVEERIVQHRPFEFSSYPPHLPQRQETFVQKQQPPPQMNPQVYLGNTEENRLYFNGVGDVCLGKDTVNSNSN